MYLTLERKDDGEAWGFSGHAGEDLEHWGGLLSGIEPYLKVHMIQAEKVKLEEEGSLYSTFSI